jgi:DNA-binding LytR/AlgR family response regulator
MINCVIIDDEQFSVDVLLKYAKLLDNLNIAGIYLNPKEALENIIGRNDIDVIFMDVDMPNLSGIELAELLRSYTKKLIFTTAHSKYAFDAYEVNGDAFLLKPFTFAKFAASINRLFPVDTANDHPVKGPSNDYFLVKNKEENLRIVRVAYDDVVAFESIHNYVKIHVVGNKKVTAYLTLKDVLELIGLREEFKQFHRAFIVSANHINYIEGSSVFLTNNLNFNVGERYRENFNSYLTLQLLKTARKQKSH